MIELLYKIPHGERESVLSSSILSLFLRIFTMIRLHLVLLVAAIFVPPYHRLLPPLWKWWKELCGRFQPSKRILSIWIFEIFFKMSSKTKSQEEIFKERFQSYVDKVRISLTIFHLSQFHTQTNKNKHREWIPAARLLARSQIWKTWRGTINVERWRRRSLSRSTNWCGQDPLWRRIWWDGTDRDSCGATTRIENSDFFRLRADLAECWQLFRHFSFDSCSLDRTKWIRRSSGIKFKIASHLRNENMYLHGQWAISCLDVVRKTRPSSSWQHLQIPKKY